MRTKVWCVWCIVLLMLSLSGCRYWSLVRFAHQFCDFDQHIQITMQEELLTLNFQDPVLPEPVFGRYFKAEPFTATQQTGGALQQTFTLSPVGDLANRYSMHARFVAVGDQHVLANAQLDRALSREFGTAFVYPILAAACSESPDIGLRAITLPLSFNVPPDDLPTPDALARLFDLALSDDASHTLHLQLDFLYPGKSSLPQWQQRPVNLYFGFHEGRWQTLHVDYDQYSLWLDFTAQRGQFHAVRM